MAFHVEFDESVQEYLARVEGLMDADRAEIARQITDELARDADRFLRLFPLSPESLCFRYDYAFLTKQTLFSFDFVVDAVHQEMGVVRVAYVECSSEPIP